jgi:anthranilate phosphoribosyltransferase
MLIKEIIALAVRRENLPFDLAKTAMDEIMTGQATPAQIASLITALKMKGETVDEICGFVSAMRERALKVDIGAMDVVDTCGTGGDCKDTFNISTLAGFVAAGAGVKIAKHGNRGVSSSCGSADLLEELGVKIGIRPEHVAACLRDVGLVFLFAPLYHDAMKHAAETRKEIGIRTIFNILGPLTNPLGAKKQLIGVYDRALTKTVATVLERTGSRHVFVVHGNDGLDEVSVSGPTEIAELNDGRIKEYDFNPKKYGIKKEGIDAIKSGSKAESAKRALNVLQGKSGHDLDIVLVNAAFAIMVADVSDDFEDALAKARSAVAEGAAYRVFEKLKKFTNEIS